MLAGGGEEFCPSEVYVFDLLYAASRRNGEPELTPRPYDNARDGLVIGEGAGIFVEELEHAKRRGAKIHAELVGYGANSDGSHVTQPQKRNHAEMYGTRAARRGHYARQSRLCQRSRYGDRKRRYCRNISD